MRKSGSWKPWYKWYNRGPKKSTRSKPRIHKNTETRNAENCTACAERGICEMCKKIYTLSTATDEANFCSTSCEIMFDQMLEQKHRYANTWNEAHGLVGEL